MCPAVDSQPDEDRKKIKQEISAFRDSLDRVSMLVFFSFLYKNEFNPQNI